jgi:hypothetical protein
MKPFFLPIVVLVVFLSFAYSHPLDIPPRTEINHRHGADPSTLAHSTIHPSPSSRLVRRGFFSDLRDSVLSAVGVLHTTHKTIKGVKTARRVAAATGTWMKYNVLPHAKQASKKAGEKVRTTSKAVKAKVTSRKGRKGTVAAKATPGGQKAPGKSSVSHRGDGAGGKPVPKTGGTAGKAAAEESSTVPEVVSGAGEEAGMEKGLVAGVESFLKKFALSRV